MIALTKFLADATSTINNGANAACGGACNTNTLDKVFGALANTLIFVVGAVSVIMIIIGGLRYVTANGDSKSVESARNTVLYSVIGVIIAIISFAIVQFVTKNIK